MAAEVELLKVMATLDGGSGTTSVYLNPAHIVYWYQVPSDNPDGSKRLRVIFSTGKAATISADDRERVQKKLDEWSHEPDKTAIPLRTPTTGVSRY